MKAYILNSFGIDHLRLEDVSDPSPGAGEVILEPRALSLNYRDLMVVRGLYNPKLKLPVIPISDAAGVVVKVGDGVTAVRPGDRVVTHFVTGWLDGPFQAHYPQTSLGTPGAGLAAERAVVPADALLKIPDSMSFDDASTLPIAALTAWSALVTEGRVQPGQSMLTLGTGGVSIFGVQLAKSFGARVFITSSSDEKLARARKLGADVAINYRANPEWDKVVRQETAGTGVNITIETGGAATLEASMRATRAGGLITFLGALTGLKSEVNLAPLLMKRLRVVGIYVDSRAAFGAMLMHIHSHRIQPVIDRKYSFSELTTALNDLADGRHFGKLVVTM